MRRFLDTLYTLSGALAALSILLITIVVILQVAFSIITRLRLSEAALTIPSYADISGYLLASSSFLALAYALTRGGHIRVTLVLNAAGPRIRHAADLFSLAVCGAISAAAVWYMANLNYQSFRFGDKSPGILAIPIWIAQIPLTLGLAVLTIAFIDLFMRTLTSGEPLPEIRQSE
jgi:TRAP-type C4-dicarboxylate transport system permease small subunit